MCGFDKVGGGGRKETTEIMPTHHAKDYCPYSHKFYFY